MRTLFIYSLAAAVLLGAYSFSWSHPSPLSGSTEEREETFDCSLRKHALSMSRSEIAIKWRFRPDADHKWRFRTQRIPVEFLVKKCRSVYQLQFNTAILEFLFTLPKSQEFIGWLKLQVRDHVEEGYLYYMKPYLYPHLGVRLDCLIPIFRDGNQVHEVFWCDTVLFRDADRDGCI